MIEINCVSKRFGSVQALQHVSLRVEPGERVAFVGSNGSGKTTLLRALLGLTRVTGKVRIAGWNVALEPERALQHVAYVPQIAPPLDTSIAEVCMAYAALRGIERRHIAAKAELLELDVHALGGKCFRELSGGMKQKLLAALALATPAPILVCDEPTANLDANARQAFFSAIEERDPCSILILCSHRQEEVHSFVERIVELRDGVLVRDERRMHRSAWRLQVAQ